MKKFYKRILFGITAVLVFSATVIAGVKSANAGADVASVKGFKVLSVGRKDVDLKWNKVSGAKGYVVYRYYSSAKDYKRVAVVHDTKYTVKDLAPGTLYKFKIKAYKKVKNGNGEKAVYSKASGELKGLTMPNDVYKVIQSNVSNTSVKLSWYRQSGATGYRVYSYNKSTKKYTRLKTLKLTSYTVKGLKPGKEYMFVIKTYANKGGKYSYGKLSPKQIVQTRPNSVSTLRQDGLTTNSYKMYWNKATGADGYYIYKYDSKQGKYIRVKTVSANTKTYEVKDAPSGVEEKYAVRSYAKFEDGNVVASSYPERYMITKPNKITNLKVSSIEETSAKLSWSKATGATGYYVYRYDNNKNTYTKVANTKSTTYSISGLKGYTDYKYKIVSYKTYRHNGNDYYTGGVSVEFTTKLGKTKNVVVKDKTNSSITFGWDKVYNATGYEVSVYNSKDELLKTEKVVKNEYKYSVEYNTTINVKIKVKAYKSVPSTSSASGSTKVVYGSANILEASNILDAVTGVTRVLYNTTSIGIEWNKLEEATKYEIYMLKSNVYEKIGETQDTKYTISSLKTGELYNIKVRGVLVKDSEEIKGNLSDAFECITQFKAPNLVVSLKSVNYLSLSWDKVTNSSGYKLYKYNTSTNKYDLMKTITSGSTLTYNDSKISAGKSYKYKMCAYRKIGNVEYVGKQCDVVTGVVGTYGIDVSQYQGTIDWKKVKASGINFAIIRATRRFSTKRGETSGKNGTKLVKDDKFDTYMKNAIAAGIKVGVYVYSYADSVAQARREAELVLQYIKPYKLTYPVYFDIEDSVREKTSYKTENTNMTIAFCDKIKAAGYKAGVYSGASFFTTYLNVSAISKYDIWVARYLYKEATFSFPSEINKINSWCIKKTYNYGNKFTSIKNAAIWQYSSSGYVNGIGGRVDMNYSYKSY